MTAASRAHVDADSLAELEEGLLDGAAGDAVRAHLAGCPRCRADLAALTGVRDRLAGAAATEPVPAEVVGRLDEALAAAAAEPAGTAATRTVTPLQAPERSRPRGMRLLQAAAVVVLLLAGGAVGISALSAISGGSGGDDSTAGSAASAPKAATGSFPLTASGRNWSATSVTAAAPRLVAGGISPTVPSDAGAAESERAGSSQDATRALSDAPAARLAGGPALADCVTALADGPVTPLAVDLSRYQGKPAAVVVLPGLAGPATMDVWVVGPGCAQGREDLLYYASVPRP